MKQKIMQRVVIALLPLQVAAIFFFGWRAFAVVSAVVAAGFVTEYITARLRGEPVSTAVFVTGLLYGLALPPAVPFLVAIVGIVVAILFGKEVFGGFGRNFANPAIVGRAFVYICFPVALTAQFIPAYKHWPGGFAQWSPVYSLQSLPDYARPHIDDVVEAMSQASPMAVNKHHGIPTADDLELFSGAIGGTYQLDETTMVYTAGSMGEGAAWLILLAGVYLLATGTANWRLMLSTLIGLGVATTLLRNVLGYHTAETPDLVVPPLMFTLLAGTTLYVTVFMVTDPISAPRRRLAQYAYGFLIGALIVLIRWRGVFVASATFAILLGNLCGPLLDIAAKGWADRKARLAGSRTPEARQ